MVDPNTALLDLDFLKSITERPREERGDALVQFMTVMRDAAERGEHDGIDRLFVPARVRDLNELAMYTLLRGTFAYRACIPGWARFRDAVRNELERQGKPWERLMQGLMGDPKAA